MNQNIEHKNLFFVGIEPEGITFEILKQLKEDLAQKYSAVQALKAPPHITLLSPRHYNHSEILDLVEKATAVASLTRTFELKLTNFAFFGNRTFYIEVGKTNELDRLRVSLLKAPGTNEPGFSFTPHLTLLNRDIDSHSMEVLRQNYKGKSFDKSIEIKKLLIYVFKKPQWEVYKMFPFTKS